MGQQEHIEHSVTVCAEGWPQERRSHGMHSAVHDRCGGKQGQGALGPEAVTGRRGGGEGQDDARGQDVVVKRGAGSAVGLPRDGVVGEQRGAWEGVVGPVGECGCGLWACKRTLLVGVEHELI